MADILFDDLHSGSDIYFDLLNSSLNASGAGVTDSAAAPTATAGSPATASGAGVTDAATAPAGTAAPSSFASGAGVTDAATGPAGAAHAYGIVTIATPLNTGPGSIFFFSNFSGTPVNGDTVRYETRNGFRVLADGSCLADINTGDYDCYYNDGSGEIQFTVTLVPFVAAWGAGVTDVASAPTVSLYGGVNISGTGVTVATSAPTGSVIIGTIATGAGATAAAAAPSAAVAAGGAASGAGPTASSVAPSGVAEVAVHADGAGPTAAASAPTATVAGDLVATGAGVTVTAAAPTASARGNRRPGDIPHGTLFIVYPKASDLQRAA